MAHMPEELKQQCWEILIENAPNSISWNHYDLATETEVTSIDLWKTFLLQPDVMEWLDEERSLLQKYELAKLTTNVSSSRSVGQAQLINAVDKINSQNRTNNDNGPIFIYSYIPLNEEQKAAPNVFELKEDIFLDGNPINIFEDSPTLPT